jgi:polyvinyl alcohol dehydrogenase (cytochrome)
MTRLPQMLQRRTLMLNTVAALAFAFSAVSATQVRAAEPTPSDAVAAEFPNQFFPENLPATNVVGFYPHDWTTYAATAGRNPVFAIPADAPQMLRDGVRWSFAGAGALPLDGPPLAGDFKTTAYTIGMPVGVSVVAGIVYVGDDNGYTYALNAATGRLVWSHYGWNMTMSNPLVSGNKVFVSTGNAYFNYANTMKYVHGERPTRGPGLNTIYALDRQSGKEIWAFHPPGEAMPTPLLDDGFLYAGTGDGHVYKLAADSGALIWKSDIVSFVSMSSLVKGGGQVFVGGTDPNFLYAIDEASGQITWKATIPDMVATGIGDCTPAYADGTVVQEVTVNSTNGDHQVANVLLALDAKTGHILWQKRFADGPVPPAMKTATPIIVDGVIYEGSPVSGDYYGIDLKTGREFWTLHLGSQIRAGAAVLDGIAYLPYRAGDIAAIRVADGSRVGGLHIGGAFGPSSPVIVGGTLYVSNIYGWVNAVPLSDIRNGQLSVAK